MVHVSRFKVMKKIYTLLFAILVFASCERMEEEWAGCFNDATLKLDPMTSFIPFSVEDNTLEEIMENIPAGVDTVGTRATSISAGGIVNNIFNLINAKKLRSYVGGYWTTDQYYNPVQLSGRIVVPKDGKVKRIMIYDHYTIAANHEAPSMTIPFESMLAELGIAIIMPDYIGYGLTVDRIPPYLMGELHARNSVDMYYAALPFLKYIGIEPEYDDIYIYGYSQGGGVAMWTTREFELYHRDTKVRIAFAGAGPYDICATYDQLVEADNTEYPFSVPLIVQGLNVGCQLNLDYKEIFQQRIIDNLDEWINSKKHESSWITRHIGSNKVSDLLTPSAMNKRAVDMSSLYRAMIDNSLTYDNTWYPECPLYAFHSLDDDVVPVINSYKLIEKYQPFANLTLNVGHYGSHSISGFHFMFSVYNFLKKNEEDF